MTIPLSCEFFPPKSDDGAAKLRAITTELATALCPEYFSVTFGAGGSTQERSFATVSAIQLESGVPAAPHLSCIGSTRAGIAAILDQYQALGIKRIVALRGDLPSGMRDPGDFRYASELVAFIRQHSGDGFHIEVAAYPEFHPQSLNAKADLQHFKHKVDAGADGAITQYFYSIEAYSRFVDDCDKRQITIPIVPGIMPINNYTQLARFSDACGADLPRWLRKRLEAFGDDMDSLRAFGHEVVVNLTADLVRVGAPGLHFYTMNQAAPIIALCQDAGVHPA
ncbi:MAG: methylenetetrahydrofolate reductase [NAD(P)H] [Halothiobacillus sp. 24-54-40]|jgi:methylenetetrahydrofolate reductase (NADPH)|nr:MAG: methylenetetrahydrofolate reductase [NAD(P)H] [Halothiobacillus sp. 35-54-62]OYY51182.1 MAG: methylenetetrahydrofolate reductase [NAD(P)H] [Halothiobacillus sp. 28-55-5]OYZ88371.1 MAG: methylenetetrahydrofolate reductase [NAD(P)H] [Halothiobacillus sp. 24-54-40]OZA81679.1 MAG: methylenetetrahydrofolate reductase [NAD(P)H] [Halothiobacillus sp. 39-53-45]HQS01830.1 methylenetetrahydrofolate reductase [NAD(P)H] [Halothiobacillus sp.]